MEASAAIRSFNYPIGTVSHVGSSFGKLAVIPCHNIRWNSKCGLYIQRLANDGMHINSHAKGKKTLASCAKTVDAINTAHSDASLGSTSQNFLEKKALQSATFPNGLEALVLEVCDETEIAELKVKVGEFEMHLKRNIGATEAPLSNISPTTPPPILSKPMDESVPSTPQSSPPKSSPVMTNPFVYSTRKSIKLVALEASGINNYVLIPSPLVGLFRRGRKVKGKILPPTFKEGDLIKEEQVVGYVEQFGIRLPVKSDVAGEVLKLLVEDGEPVGYGDNLIAILPSFHDIK